MKKIILSLIVLVSVSAFTYGQRSSASADKPASGAIYSQEIVNANRADGCNFLVLMDNLPWGSSAVTDILTANGETFSVAGSGTFPGLDFSDYDVIIVCSDQVPAFYAVFAANFTKFVNFVNDGGSLEVHAATCGWNSPCGYSVVLPGGVYTTEQYNNNNNVVDALHPITAGIPNPFFGTYASHGYFSNLQAGTDIITETSTNNLPTTIQYTFGSGIVTATTCTYEYGYEFGETAGDMLVNNLNYSCEHAQNVPLTGWALGIGIALILGVAIFRFRRLV